MGLFGVVLKCLFSGKMGKVPGQQFSFRISQFRMELRGDVKILH